MPHMPNNDNINNTSSSSTNINIIQSMRQPPLDPIARGLHGHHTSSANTREMLMEMKPVRTSTCDVSMKSQPPPPAMKQCRIPGGACEQWPSSHSVQKWKPGSTCV